MESRQRILYVAESMNACAWYRCVTPGRELAECGYDVRVDISVTLELASWADVVVLQRFHEPYINDVIAFCKHSGKRLVYELDDDLWNIHPDSGAHAFYSRPDVLGPIEEALRAAHVVTTTTPALAERLSSMNRTVVVLPNMLPDQFWPYEEPVEQREDRVIIGWAGTNTHLPDLKLLVGVMEQLLDRYPAVEFWWAGMREVPFRNHPRIRRLEGVDLPDYPELLGNFHVGLAPLVDSVFNRCKSDLKFVEYARRGIPVVASRVEAYAGTVRHGET
ncbi:MAG: hypothetical protein ABFC80_05845, partial [Coriobacteriales bacterium]